MKEKPFQKLEFDLNWRVAITLDGKPLDKVKMLEVLWPDGYRGLYRARLAKQPVTYNDMGKDFPSTEEELYIEVVQHGLVFWLPVLRDTKLQFRRSRRRS